jgi:hypothetical protein
MIDDQPTYSPEVQDYINRIQALSPSMGGFHLAPQYSQYSEQVQEPASDSYDTVTHYVDPRDYQSAIAAGTDPQNLYGADIRDWGGARTSTGWNPVQLMLGNNYRLTDKTSGKTFDASTPDQIRQMIAQTNALSGVGGNNTASWDVSQVNPDGTLTSKATDTPYTPSFLKQAGQFVADQLPSVFASMALGPEAGWAIKGLGAAGATAAYQGAKGASLQDSLLAGLKSGVTAGAMSYASPYIGGALKDAGLDFPGSGTLFPSGSSDPFSFGGGGGGVYGGHLPSADPNMESVLSGVVRANPITPDLSGLSSLALPQLSAPDASVPDAQKPAQQPAHDPVDPNTESAIVTAYRSAPEYYSSLAAQGLLSAADAAAVQSLESTPKAADPTKANETSDLSKGLTAAKYAALGLGLIGGAGAAGSGNNTGSSIYSSSLANPQKLPDIFHASLGSGTGGLGGAGSAPGTSANRTQLDPQTDWNTYGERPELPFFSDIPKRMAHGGALPAEHDAAPRQSFAVNGAGDGRSDSIPAKLSDGEYVMDAETVSLLGNGSNKAGAHQLDQFRVNLRKHKGAELAKGRFSVNAKNPQAYMAGGNT